MHRHYRRHYKKQKKSVIITRRFSRRRRQSAKPHDDYYAQFKREMCLLNFLFVSCGVSCFVTKTEVLSFPDLRSNDTSDFWERSLSLISHVFLIVAITCSSSSA